MGTYLLLKHLHLTLVVLSGLGFALRGYLKLALEWPLDHPMVRLGPHLLDTLLLISGVGLWWATQYSLLSWFGAKMLLVLVYIILGIMAFRIRNRPKAILIYLLALLCFLTIAALAMHRPF